ncbi:coiled-coil domain-containing protein [Symbiopectobacterium purcellii]|uniref:coiled-coil domain-containing protein n=1 Tax=Symbiopectobacterium purcellii TaxID=2871826 RepID=UPI003F8639D3
MGQVAFDTQEFVEKLENSGLNREQAKAITLVVRQSHEVADLATKRDLEDVRKDLTVQIADVRKDMQLVRKDLQLEMAGIRSEQKLMRWMLSAGILGILSLVVKAFLVTAL